MKFKVKLVINNKTKLFEFHYSNQTNIPNIQMHWSNNSFIFVINIINVLDQLINKIIKVAPLDKNFQTILEI